MKKILIQNNLTRDEICENIKNNYGLSKAYSHKFLNDLFETIITTINKKKSLSIKNFGTFKLNIKKSRIGRNPRTKEEFEIKARKTVTFKASRKLILKIRNK